jgi:hypothetical protein
MSHAEAEDFNKMDMQDTLMTYLSLIWLGGAICLIFWLHVSSWLWRRQRPSLIVEKDLHGGKSPLMTSLTCFLWPLIFFMWLYEKIR